MQNSYWLNDMLQAARLQREESWSVGLAVGRPGFVAEVNAVLGRRAVHRQITMVDGAANLREDEASYAVCSWFW